MLYLTFCLTLVSDTVYVLSAYSKLQVSREAQLCIKERIVTAARASLMQCVLKVIRVISDGATCQSELLAQIP